MGHRPPRSAAQQVAPAPTRAESRMVLAVDGKTLRGAQDTGGNRTKLISFYDHQRGWCSLRPRLPTPMRSRPAPPP